MSGYNNNNWRRRDRDSGPQRTHGSESQNFWTDNHYDGYAYNHFSYPQDSGYFPQWSSWTNQNQFNTSYIRETPPPPLPPPLPPISSSRHSFGPNQGHSKTGHSSSHPLPIHNKNGGHHSSHISHRSQSPKNSGHHSSHPSQSHSSQRSQSPEPRNWYSHEKHSVSRRSQSPSDTRVRHGHHHSDDKYFSAPISSSKSHHHSKKSKSPPLGSEEARKKTLAQATDKIKSCLLSFQSQKSEVLENLLSAETGTKKDECTKSNTMRVEKSAYTPELQLTPSDLKVIGMVNNSSTSTLTEGNESDSFSLPERPTEKSDSYTTEKRRSYSTSDREPINTTKDVDNHSSRQSALQHTKSAEINSSENLKVQSETSSLNLFCQPRSSSLNLPTEVSSKNQMSGEGTNSKKIHEHPRQTIENEPNQTVKCLKQRIIQQFLKMSKNNLKDLINNPRSRKFEYAMNHLMKEHRMLLSRELRGLAQSRIRGQGGDIQEQREQMAETSSLLDTDIAIDLSHLPQEVIEQLGSFLQLDLLDSAGSVDFQPIITAEDENSVHDLQNIQALQVALLSEENIKKEVVESDIKSQTEILNTSACEQNRNNTDALENIGKPQRSESGPMEEGNIATEDTDEREVVYEEGGAAKKTIKKIDKWPSYIPLGKGFMSRTGEFGNLFCEFPDFLGMGSSETEADEQDSNIAERTNEQSLVESIEQPSSVITEISEQQITSKIISSDPYLPENLDVNMAANDQVENFSDQMPPVKSVENTLKEVAQSINKKESINDSVGNISEMQPMDISETIQTRNNFCDAIEHLEEACAQVEKENSAHKENKDIGNLRVESENPNDPLPEADNVSKSQRVNQEPEPSLVENNDPKGCSEVDAFDDDMDVDTKHFNAPNKESDVASRADAGQLQSAVNKIDHIDRERDLGMQNVDKSVHTEIHGGPSYIEDILHKKPVGSKAKNGGTKKECEETHLPGNEAEDISVEDLYGDLIEYSNTDEMDSSAIAKIQTQNIQKENTAVGNETTQIPLNNVQVSLNGRADVCGEEHQNTTSIGTEGGINFEHEDEVTEIYRCNIVIKSERIDDSNEVPVPAEGLPMEHSSKECTSRRVGEFQHGLTVSETQDAALTERGIQTEPQEELDSNDIQRMLQLLEKSSQLSPQLAKLLKDHFSSNRPVDESDTSKISSNRFIERTPITALRERSPPLSTAKSFIHDSSGVSVGIGTFTQLTSIIGEEIERNLRAPPLISGRGRKIYPKRGRILKPDLQDASREERRNQEDSSDKIIDIGAVDSAVQSVNITEEIAPLSSGQESREQSMAVHTRYVFLKMLEIDKEIQRLMEVKLKLYRKLQSDFENDSPSLSRDGNLSPKSRILQYTSQTPITSKEVSGNVLPSQNLNDATELPSTSNTHQLHKGFTGVNNELLGSAFGGDKPASTSTPMVILPMDFVLGSSSDQHNVHPTLPRHKVSERLKTFDTSVVEAVLNSFNLPDSQNRSDEPLGEDATDQSTQNKQTGECNEDLTREENSNTSKSRRHVSSRVNTSGKETHQSERTLPPKIQSSRKQTSKSKSLSGKESQNVETKKHFTPDSPTKRSASNRGLTKELKNLTQVDGIEINENISESSIRKIRQRQGSTKNEEESSPSVVTEEKTIRSRRQRQATTKNDEKSESNNKEEKKDVRSPTKSRLKNEKQPESENTATSSRSRRSFSSKQNVDGSDEISSQSKSRKETRIRTPKEDQLPLEESAESDNTKKETRTSKRRHSTNTEESERSNDHSSRPTQKRKISTKSDSAPAEPQGDTGTSSQQEVDKSTHSRRARTSRPLAEQESQPVSNAETDLNKKKRKNVKMDIAPQSAETAATIPQSPSTPRKQTRTSTPTKEKVHSNNSKEQPKSEVTAASGVNLTPSKTRKQANGAQKRKADEIAESPAKLQCTNMKPDLLKMNLKSCFVMVKPLSLDKVEDIVSASGTPVKESMRERRSSTSSDELPVAEMRKKGKVKGKRKTVDQCERVDLPENPDEQVDESESQQDPLGGIPDTPQPPELQAESDGIINSSPMQLPPDLLMQTSSPRPLDEPRDVPEIGFHDENSISTLVSDSVSVTSDGDQPYSRKTKAEDKSLSDVLGADSKDDCDRDSTYSVDTTAEGREGTSSRASKHKSSRKHRKDRKTEIIERLKFESHKGPILDIKTVGRHILAASEDGCVYCYSLKSGKFKRKYEGHAEAVTCLSVAECPNINYSSDVEGADSEIYGPDLFFTGSLDRRLRQFNFKSGQLVGSPVDVGSAIQCMDQNWGTVYIGTKSGEIAVYSIKLSSLINEPIKIGKEAVLALKATKEGPRQVLIVGARNQPITVRDASSGLLLRDMCHNWSHTVYSLVLGPSTLYCGTKTGSILAVEFTSGDEVCRFQAGSGVVCVRLYNNLLFAACYDGNIYVFSIQDKKQVMVISGPGKMMLCMDIVKNRIIAGSKDSNRLESWGFPKEIRNLLKEAKHR